LVDGSLAFLLLSVFTFTRPAYQRLRNRYGLLTVKLATVDLVVVVSVTQIRQVSARGASRGNGTNGWTICKGPGIAVILADGAIFVLVVSPIYLVAWLSVPTIITNSDIVIRHRSS
jgi:hypothetical protein